MLIALPVTLREGGDWRLGWEIKDGEGWVIAGFRDEDTARFVLAALERAGAPESDDRSAGAAKERGR